MKWKIYSVATLQASRSDGMGLSVMVFEGKDSSEWVLAAATASLDAARASATAKQALTSIFDGMRMVVEVVLDRQRSLSDAIKEAERYARWWQREKPVDDGCACTEIDAEFEPPRPADRLRAAFGHLGRLELFPAGHAGLHSYASWTPRAA